MKHPLGKRLLSAANFVRQGAYLADIGTDHAYLPLFLLDRGVIGRAVCADINEGPLASAVENARECGLSDRITFKLTNGAIGLSDMGITDYAICGMGGELIAEIIDASGHLKEKGVHLILQPMTKPEILRERLYADGFEILEERTAYDGKRAYIIMLAAYTGDRLDIDELFAFTGKVTDTEFLRLTAKKLIKNARGMESSESFAEEAHKLRSLAEKILEKAEEMA